MQELEPFSPGDPVEIVVTLGGVTQKYLGIVQAQEADRVGVRLANRMLVSAERAIVFPCEPEQAQ